jgi:hypothetical protein
MSQTGEKMFLLTFFKKEQMLKDLGFAGGELALRGPEMLWL